MLQGLVNVADLGMSPSDAGVAARFPVASGPIDVTDRVPCRVTDVLGTSGYEVVGSFRSHDLAEVHVAACGGDGWTGGADPLAGGVVIMVDAAASRSVAVPR